MAKKRTKIQLPYKQYTSKAIKGVRGEAFFEMLIVNHAIPHRVARQNDVGVDFLCEWVVGEMPTGVMFSAQVKWLTTKTQKTRINEHNHLQEFCLPSAKKVDDRTLNYWRGLGFPSYLFCVVEDAFGKLNCFYKRYTPLVAPRRDNLGDPNDAKATKLFFKVNDESKFLDVADKRRMKFGFSRDLIVDYIRMAFHRGHFVANPDTLIGWPLDLTVADILQEFSKENWYGQRLKSTTELIQELLRRQSPD